ncbi:MAG: hypothetical protein ABFS35_02540 [Bacteroidota bacterium]
MINKNFDDPLTSVELAKKITKITRNSTTGIVSFTLGALAEMNDAKSQIVIDEDVEYVLNSIEDEIFHESFIKEKISNQITEFESVIHSASMNINPTFVRLWISAKNDKQTLVQIYIASKEDLSNADKTNSAIEEIKKRFKWTFGD